MEFRVGPAIVWGKRCPMCSAFMIPRHMVEAEVGSFAEKDGFCVGAQNFYVCGTCHSRFEAISVGEKNECGRNSKRNGKK